MWSEGNPMREIPGAPAPSRNGGGKDVAFRSVSEAPSADREAQKAEARGILVRLLVRCCMERRKVAA
jgi:hypothetical protein